MRWTRVLFALAVAAGLGLAVFSLLARQATHIEDASPPEAQSRFSALRDTLQGRTQPLIWWDESGRLQRGVIPVVGIDEVQPAAPRSIAILAYRARDQKLTEVEIPFWFFRLKEPALGFALRGVDFDWKNLGLSSQELRRAGPGLVMDESDREGNLVLMWLE